MTTAPEALTQEETLATLGRYDFGWADSDVAGASARCCCATLRCTAVS